MSLNLRRSVLSALRLSPALAAFLLAAAAPAASGDQPFPSDMECVAQPHYCRRSDGKPGREITLNLKGDKLAGKAQVEVMVNGRTETVKLPSVAGGRSAGSVLLPPEAG